MTKYQKFYEMDIWKEAYELGKEIFELTLRFPKEEKYSLIDQLNRSSNSVTANIAEAHGRYHYADKVRVLYIVRGEIEETQSHLIVSVGRKYTVEVECENLVGRYEKLKIKVNNYIGNFCKRKSNDIE